MASYIILGRYTEQGVRNIKEGPQRVEAARRAIEAAGGKMAAFYLTLGQYDFVVVAEGPDDETVARVLLGIASAGNIKTETLRAFTEEEFRRIVAGLP